MYYIRNISILYFVPIFGRFVQENRQYIIDQSIVYNRPSYHLCTVPPRNNLSKTASWMRLARVCWRPQMRPSCVSPTSDPRSARVCGRPQTRLPAGTISFCCLRASGRRKHITSEFFGNIACSLTLSVSSHVFILFKSINSEKNCV